MAGMVQNSLVKVMWEQTAWWAQVSGRDEYLGWRNLNPSFTYSKVFKGIEGEENNSLDTFKEIVLVFIKNYFLKRKFKTEGRKNGKNLIVEQCNNFSYNNLSLQEYNNIITSGWNNVISWVCVCISI